MSEGSRRYVSRAIQESTYRLGGLPALAHVLAEANHLGVTCVRCNGAADVATKDGHMTRCPLCRGYRKLVVIRPPTLPAELRPNSAAARRLVLLFDGVRNRLAIAARLGRNPDSLDISRAIVHARTLADQERWSAPASRAALQSKTESYLKALDRLAPDDDGQD